MLLCGLPKAINKPKTAAERAARVKKILATLDQMYPDVTCALHHSSAWELLVATILSAQCTDKRVNMVTPGLFKKYPTIQDFAAVSQDELAQDIKSTGFFNNKAKSVIGAAKKILSDFGGEIPQDIDKLLDRPRRGAQNRQRRAGNRFRHRIRGGGGYARPAHLSPPGPDEGNRAGEDRKGSDEDHPEREVDSLFAPDHSSWPRPCASRATQSAPNASSTHSVTPKIRPSDEPTVRNPASSTRFRPTEPSAHPPDAAPCGSRTAPVPAGPKRPACRRCCADDSSPSAR